jgi:site-specific DNA recombinase
MARRAAIRHRDRAEVDAERISLRLSRPKLAAELTGDDQTNGNCADAILLSIETTLKRAGTGKRLIIEDGAVADVNLNLVALLREAFSLRERLMSGGEESIEDMSRRVGINKARLTSLVRLSYHAPDLVHRSSEGRQPVALTPTGLLKLSKDLPKDWDEQRRFLGWPG